MSHSYFNSDDDTDDVWNHPDLVRSLDLEQTRQVLVCKDHLQPCAFLEGRWTCVVLPVRARCHDPMPIPKPNNTQRLLITIEIVSSTTFSLQSYPLCESLGNALRSRQYPLYSFNIDVFEIPIDHYESVVYDLLPSVTKGFVLQMDTIPKNALSLILRKAQHLEMSDNYIDPEIVIPDIWKRLLPFQRESVQFAISRDGRVLLADDMGLGKTLQCIALLKYYQKNWPVVIACPASLCPHWTRTVKEWLIRDDLKTAQVKHIKSKAELLSACRLPDIAVMSYSLIPTCVDIISSRWDNRWMPGIIVCDESHYLKESKSQRVNALRSWIMNAKRAIFISGTPALNRPAELYSTVTLLRQGLLGSRIDYAKRYCQGYFDPKTKVLRDRGCSHSTELYLVLSKSIMIRHLKKDISNQLPPKVRHVVSVTSSEVIANADHPEWKSAESAILAGNNPTNSSLALYQQSSKLKIAPAWRLISKILSNPGVGPIIVFAHHSVMMDGIEGLLVRAGISFIRVDGTASATERSSSFDIFVDGNTRVALLSIGSCSSGLNFASMCSTVVFAELAWSPGIHLQAEDRIHRIGQKEAQCNYYYLLVHGTSDDIMWPALRKKLDNLSRTLDGVNEHSFRISSTTCMDQN